MKCISEIFFTSNYVTEEVWLDFLLKIGKLNGYFKKIKIITIIEKNDVRYFLKTSRAMPTVVGDISEILLKKIDIQQYNEKYRYVDSFFKSFYIVTNKEKNIVDVVDKNEVKFHRNLIKSEINIFPINKSNYLTGTNFTFEKNKRLIHKKALFNIPHIFLSIDFSKHTRFLYRKDVVRYLDIQKTVHLFENQNKNSFLQIDGFPYIDDKYFLNLSNYDFAKHSLVVGGSGTGKSKMISSLITQISKNPTYKMNYKVVVIDPHSDMQNDIGGIEKTGVFNFETPDESLKLFNNSVTDISTSAELTLSLFKNLLQDVYNSKLERVLRHSIILLLSNNCLSFENLRKLILEVQFRNSYVRNTNVPVNVREFFLSDFNELKTTSYQEAIAPIISLIDEIQTLPAFQNDGKIRKSLKDSIDENFLTILSLNQVKLGERTTKTIAGLLMSQMLQLIQAYTFNEHIIFIIDEVAVVENPLIHRFLSEARKYNLSLILAQQYFNQVSSGLQKAIFANTNNYYVFRVSREDAIILSGNMQMDVAVHNSHFARNRILTELGNRECVVRITSNGKVLPAFKARTLNFVPTPMKVKKEIDKKEIDNQPKNEVKRNFCINTSIGITEIMRSQSNGRRKMAN